MPVEEHDSNYYIEDMRNQFVKAHSKFKKACIDLKELRDKKKIGDGKPLYEDNQIKSQKEKVRRYEEKMYRISGIFSNLQLSNYLEKIYEITKRV